MRSPPWWAVRKLQFQEFAGLQSCTFGCGILRCIRTIECNYLAWASAYNVHGFVLGVRVDRQRAERRWWDCLGNTPPIAQRHLPLSQEEAEAVLEHRNRRDLGFPSVGVLLLVLRTHARHGTKDRDNHYHNRQNAFHLRLILSWSEQ